MPQYYLSQFQRLNLELRGDYSALSEPRKEGFFRLYNKNAAETLYVKPVSQVPNRAVWIVETESVPRYFIHVLTPVLAAG